MVPKSFSSFSNALLGREQGTMAACGDYVQDVTRPFGVPLNSGGLKSP